MNKKLKSLIGAITGVTMLLSPLGVYAAPVTGTDITSATIPVVATIDTYYEVSIPVDADGNLNLTRKYNSFLKTTGDTNGTFYGRTLVGLKGVIGSDKKVSCDFSCTGLTRTDAGAASPTPEHVAVGMRALSSAQGTIASAIWADNGSSANKIEFGAASGWSTSTPSSPAITIDFLSTDINASTITDKPAMLRTTLETDGTYTGSLVIDFAIKDA